MAFVRNELDQYKRNCSMQRRTHRNRLQPGSQFHHFNGRQLRAHSRQIHGYSLSSGEICFALSRKAQLLVGGCVRVWDFIGAEKPQKCFAVCDTGRAVDHERSHNFLRKQQHRWNRIKYFGDYGYAFAGNAP